MIIIELGQRAAPVRGAYAVIVTGALVCALFFCTAVSDTPPSAAYPREKSVAALEAFGREHTALAAVLGIDEYFPEEAVYAGTFGSGGERWTFSEYLRDAFHTFLFGSGQ